MESDVRYETPRKPPVKIVVAGASGLIGKRHLQHVVDEPEAELVAIIPVYHRDPDVLGLELANQHQRPCFRNVADFLASLRAGEILADAVILATPNNTHAPLATKLVVAGLAVLVEKPFTATGAEGRELLKARSEAPSGKAVVMVGHHRRHNPYTIAVKQAIDEGRLGRIVAINGVWAMRKPPEYFANHWRRQLGSGGVVLNNAIHEIDILQYLLGNIVEVYAVEGVKERPHPVDETVLATLKFASGAVGSFLFSDTAISPHSWESATGENPHIPAANETCLTILGTKGSVGIPSLTRFHQDDRPHQEQNWSFPLTRDNTLKSQIDNDDTPPLARQLKHFIAAVRGEVEPNCSGEDGLRAVMVVEAILKSLEKHEPVTVERV
ncbi:uncharacterized protein Z520_08220 [Fonsecaea multimorphosa CBS 102226]|uniref:Gfo/Idh/MocA-like oxidoreductase N-terminal domain-containing protein n=1 Tax=Fonsecaea multimorphosa CBS 102226 TaxID=1442371 RepID=A0A0D2H2A3_9EURO|nr:uncharacterized protein Z520_08220 [Fonsecaea multimorphosa CBS 102226]KIX95965.1 hypothetical protein Z520_08220 [Fonsecaea multimorphosa CBS 102226]